MELERPQLPTFIVMYSGPGNGYKYRFSYAATAEEAQTEFDSGREVGIRAVPFPVPEDPVEAMALLLMFKRMNLGEWLTNGLIPTVTNMALEVERADQE